jgi:hypothetical protein
MERLIRFYNYAKKAIIAAANAVLLTAAVFEDGTLTPEERVAIVAAWLAVFGVYQVTNSKKL